MRSCAPALATALAALVVAGCTRRGPDECPTTRPSPRAALTAVRAPTTNQLYVYGGALPSGATAASAELWRYSFGACGGWLRLDAAAPPGPLAGYAAAFDDKRRRIIYVGGAANDAWALDSDAITWKKLAPVGRPPVPSDGERDRLVVGAVGTYTLDFSASADGTWQATTFPAGGGAVAALDPTRGQILTIAPSGMSGFVLATGVTHVVSSSGDVPSDVDGAALAFDAQLARLVLLGGSDVYAIDLDGNGTSARFTRIATTGPAPPPRRDAAFAISGGLGVVFAGATPSGCVLDDLWYLADERQWSAQAMATTCP